MITPVYIIKDSEDGSNIFYHVTAPIEAQDFYIGINVSTKKLTFFKTRLGEPLKSMDLSGEDVEFEKIPGIDTAVANFVTARVYSAILKNESPNEIKYNFH